MGFFIEEDEAVIWRGPMLHKALEQFLTDVFWDEPDFLVVDMPPGTGDVALSMSQYLPRAEIYVVTTPQAAAQRVAQRTAAMAKKLNLPVRGVIENMSWFTGDDGKRYELFGAGGGQLLADDIGAPLLGPDPARARTARGRRRRRARHGGRPELRGEPGLHGLAETVVDLGAVPRLPQRTEALLGTPRGRVPLAHLRYTIVAVYGRSATVVGLPGAIDSFVTTKRTSWQPAGLIVGVVASAPARSVVPNGMIRSAEPVSHTAEIRNTPPTDVFLTRTA